MAFQRSKLLSVLQQRGFSKALGTGISNGINFNEIVILNKKSGKPYISLIGKTNKTLKKKFKHKS